MERVLKPFRLFFWVFPLTALIFYMKNETRMISRHSGYRLVMMSDHGINSTGAVCLDGSDAGFYISRGQPENQQVWQIHFQGGGWCYDQEDCWARSSTTLGSSLHWETQDQSSDSIRFAGNMESQGIMSKSCRTNPSLCQANKVILRYCDGFSFVGDRVEPFVVHGKQIYSRGKRILNAALETLLKYGLDDAASVLLTGCSAGGLATFIHADFAREWLQLRAPRLRKFMAMPSSGVFPDHASVDGFHTYGLNMQSAFEIANGSQGSHAGCVAAMRRTGRPDWRCSFAENLIEHIKTPLFLVQSGIDKWSTSCLYTISNQYDRQPCNSWYCKQRCSSSQSGSWHDCADYFLGHIPEQCSQVQTNFFNRKMMDTMNLISDGLNDTQSGYFVHSCFTHCESNEDVTWGSIRIDGVVLAEAFGLWWNSNGSISPQLGPCSLSSGQCNPSCPTVPLLLSIGWLSRELHYIRTTLLRFGINPSS